MSDSDNSSASGDEDNHIARPIQIRVAPDSSTPILCSFPGGLPSALQSNNNADAELPTFLWNKQQNDVKTTLFGKDDACFYTATVSDKDKDKQSVKYCVGVFDKRTNTLTLSQAACNGSVFALNQSVRNYQAHTESSAEARLSLVQDFSSAKKQKVLRSQAANRVKADSVVGAGKLLMNGVKQTMSESNQQAMAEGRDQQQQNAAIQLATDAWRSDFLPPFDATAAEPCKAYKAKKIVSKESWKQVGRVVEACLHKDDVAAAILDGGDGVGEEAPKQYPGKSPPKRFFTTIEDLIARLCSEPVDHLEKDRLQCAILVNHFATLYTSLEKRKYIQPPALDRTRFFGTPLEFASFFLDKFTTSTLDAQGNEGHVMSKTDKDRCMAHMLILYIIADSGTSMRTANIKPLLDDIKQDLTSATQLLRQAGFTMERKSGTSTTTAYLRTPLTFPSGIRKRALKAAGR
ncbi:hypothetical protein MPSEU_000811600 [Mayamaea pseudoterrestris]|nr:hypothetical protein MPSEU_000811600 [Mayamaea pseudoterrestris]